MNDKLRNQNEVCQPVKLLTRISHQVRNRARSTYAKRTVPGPFRSAPNSVGDPACPNTVLRREPRQSSVFAGAFLALANLDFSPGEKSKLNAKAWLTLCGKIGLFGFGSSWRMLAYQEAVVNKFEVLEDREFAEIMTLAQILPGLPLINVSACLAYRLFNRFLALWGVLVLSLPGAVLIVFAARIPIAEPFVMRWFQGVAVGSLFMLGILIFRLLKSLVPAEGGDKISVKRILQILLIVLTAVGLYAGVSLLPVLVAGTTASLLLEAVWTTPGY